MFQEALWSIIMLPFCQHLSSKGAQLQIGQKMGVNNCSYLPNICTAQNAAGEVLGTLNRALWLFTVLMQQVNKVLFYICRSSYFLLYIFIYITPPHSASCPGVSIYRICDSEWKKKHHRRKLQWVKPRRVQGESLCQRLREKLTP